MAEKSGSRDENGKPLRSFFGAETPEAAVVHLGDGASTIISDEAIVHKQLALASLQPGLRVLEIGVGTGYLAARAAQRVGDPRLVYGVDVLPELIDLAGANLRQVGMDGIQLLAGDGLVGWPGKEPFDRIILSCAVCNLPWQLLRQLAPSGIMVLPLSRGWPIEGLLLSVRYTGEQVEALAASMGRFVPAQFQQAPPSLVACPIPSFLPGMECQMLLSGPAAAVPACSQEAGWRISDPPVGVNFGEFSLMRCAALLELLHPHSTCFLAVKDLSPLCVGVYQDDPFGVAAIAPSLNPPDPNRFGPVYSLGVDEARASLLKVVARASSDSTEWLSDVAF